MVFVRKEIEQMMTSTYLAKRRLTKKKVGLFDIIQIKISNQTLGWMKSSITTQIDFFLFLQILISINLSIITKSISTMSMRKLKHHEQKLLKKVNFYDWKAESDRRQSRVMHRYHLQNREDYSHYNKICGLITSLICKIKQLPIDDLFRVKATEQLLDKLYNLGVINSRENIQVAEKISVSAFCRRRLAVMLCSLKFAETMKQAITFVEQGHIRIGTQTITSPALLVPKQLQDHVGWVDNSSIKRKILKYNDKLDDYDLMN